MNGILTRASVLKAFLTSQMADVLLVEITKSGMRWVKNVSIVLHQLLYIKKDDAWLALQTLTTNKILGNVWHALKIWFMKLPQRSVYAQKDSHTTITFVVLPVQVISFGTRPEKYANLVQKHLSTTIIVKNVCVPQAFLMSLTEGVYNAVKNKFGIKNMRAANIAHWNLLYLWMGDVWHAQQIPIMTPKPKNAFHALKI